MKARRGRARTAFLTACNKMSALAIAAYRQAGTWNAAGAKLGVSGGMAFRVAKGYIPKDPAILAKFGQTNGAACHRCRGSGCEPQNKKLNKKRARLIWKIAIPFLANRHKSPNGIYGRGGRPL